MRGAQVYGYRVLVAKSFKQPAFPSTIYSNHLATSLYSQKSKYRPVVSARTFAKHSRQLPTVQQGQGLLHDRDPAYPHVLVHARGGYLAWHPDSGEVLRWYSFGVESWGYSS